MSADRRRRRRVLAAAAAAAAGPFAVPFVRAQAWLAKPMRYIVPFAPGGMPPEELAAIIRNDIPDPGKVVRESGAKVD